MEHKPRAQIGVLGASGHGKTALLRSLKTQLDQRFGSAEPLPRTVKPQGVGNAASYACQSSHRYYLLVDTCGAAGFHRARSRAFVHMDAAILVQRASRPVSVCVLEQLLFARAAGVKHIVVYLNDEEQVSHDACDATEQQLRALLFVAGFAGDNTDFVRASTDENEAMRALVTHLDALPIDHLHSPEGATVIAYTYYIGMHLGYGLAFGRVLQGKLPLQSSGDRFRWWDFHRERSEPVSENSFALPFRRTLRDFWFRWHVSGLEPTSESYNRLKNLPQMSEALAGDSVVVGAVDYRQNARRSRLLIQEFPAALRASFRARISVLEPPYFGPKKPLRKSQNVLLQFPAGRVQASLELPHSLAAGETTECNILLRGSMFAPLHTAFLVLTDNRGSENPQLFAAASGAVWPGIAATGLVL